MNDQYRTGMLCVVAKYKTGYVVIVSPTRERDYFTAWVSFF